ncbi:hypothetical protein [Sporomusa malonica]|uniref:Uncharacterized protein n=1 Tax=Sporomusa malonica TaxID=112901 RepID=A0A1W1YVR0_9FIRM|nr:hypothetical protein [Sporomusa malonica]SMC40216.1 hypothetical protein SAMN04488500_102228 [Sporomusa malonica]
MKKIVFLAHDPGGYDVIFPVAKSCEHDGISGLFYCIGPAAQLNPLHGIVAKEALQAIQDLLDSRKIAGLVTGTSWGSSVELQAIAACKQAGIPNVAILDYWSNYQIRFVSQAGEVIYPDYYIVMDELAKAEAVQAGVPPAIISVLGHPGLDKYIACQSSARGLNEQRKKILFLSQPLSVLYGETLGYTEQQALADCCKVVANQDNCILHVKFHPKDEASFQQRYDELAVAGNLIDIMPEYDLIIGMSTMGLLHAALLGIPTISYQPNLRKQDLCITNKLGLTKRADSPQELQLLLSAKMDGQVNNNSSQLSHRLIWLDGRSTERVVRFIREVFK